MGLSQSLKIGRICCDFRCLQFASLAAQKKPKPVLEDYGMSEAQLLQQIQAYNSIDQLQPLAKAHDPIFLWHGTKDRLVPSVENSDQLLINYQLHGGHAVVDQLSGLGHGDSPS